MTAQRNPLLFPRYSWDSDTLPKRMRMCRGLHQLGILELIRQRTEGRRRAKGEAFPEWTDRVVWSQVAKEWGCTAAALRKECEDGEKRGMWQTRNDGPGVNLRARYDNWDQVKDIERRLQRVDAEEAAQEAAAEEAAKKQATREEVREFPVHEGRPSKVVKMTVPPSSFSVSVQGGAARISGIRQGPHLTLSVKVESSKSSHLRSQNATGVAHSSGAGSPHAPASPPRGRVSPSVDPPGANRGAKPPVDLATCDALILACRNAKGPRRLLLTQADAEAIVRAMGGPSKWEAFLEMAHKRLEQAEKQREPITKRLLLLIAQDTAAHAADADQAQRRQSYGD